MILTVPAFFAFTTPLESTVAILLLLDVNFAVPVTPYFVTVIFVEV